MARPEYEITHAAIRYALQCTLERNWHALREEPVEPPYVKDYDAAPGGLPGCCCCCSLSLF